MEWASVAIPFFGIIGATFDLVATQWAILNLNNSLSDVARTIQTGKFQTDNRETDPAVILPKFRDKLCSDEGTTVRLLFVSCDKVKVQIQSFSSMSSSQSDSPMDANGQDWSRDFGTKYSAPGPGAIVVVQAAFKFPIYMNVFKITPTFSDGSRLVSSTVVFRTEPYR